MMRVLIAVGATAVAAAGAAVVLGLGRATPPDIALLNANHQCSYCHVSHGAEGGSLLVDNDVEVLCLSCHGPGGTSPLKADRHKGQTCMVCHDPHDGQFNRFGTRNLKMMRAEVIPRDSSTPRPVTFESRGTDVGQPVLHSFCDDDLDGDMIWDNVCDTCHRNDPDEHSYTDPGSHGHNTGRTCTVCHFHDDGFDADG